MTTVVIAVMKYVNNFSKYDDNNIKLITTITMMYEQLDSEKSIELEQKLYNLKEKSNADYECFSVLLPYPYLLYEADKKKIQ